MPTVSYTTNWDTIERSVPEVFNSTYDIRKLLVAAARLRDGKPYPVPALVRNFVGEKSTRPCSAICRRS